MGEFDGKAALVTGGALGIGQGIVRAFAREGDAVAVADLNRGAAATLVAELAEDGACAVAAVGDVSSAADAEHMVRRASFITGEYLCVDGGFMALGAWASSAGSSAGEGRGR